jgi:hypothetical protein
VTSILNFNESARWIGEQHVREESFADSVEAIRLEPWVGRFLLLDRGLVPAKEQRRPEHPPLTGDCRSR